MILNPTEFATVRAAMHVLAIIGATARIDLPDGPDGEQIRVFPWARGVRVVIIVDHKIHREEEYPTPSAFFEAYEA